jgi:hypothetical protein
VEEILERLALVNSDWSRKALETMGRMSPTAMKVRPLSFCLRVRTHTNLFFVPTSWTPRISPPQVVHRQLTLGKKLDLAECLAMDYRISQRMMKGKTEKARLGLLEWAGVPR